VVGQRFAPRLVDAVADAGKRQYPIPLYVNAWLVQSPTQAPGAYPSGGPVSRVLDVWKAGAKNIDLFAPDIYLPAFKAICESYSRPWNPLFIPEADNGNVAAANAFYAFGRFRAIGYCVVAAEDLNSDHPLADSYSVLRQLVPLMAANSRSGRMVGILKSPKEASFTFERYRAQIEPLARDKLDRERKRPDLPDYGIIINTARDEFTIAGAGFSVAFTTNPPDQAIAGIASVDEGRFESGRWMAQRRLNGDETDGGKSVILPRGSSSIQRVTLYRHD